MHRKMIHYLLMVTLSLPCFMYGMLPRDKACLVDEQKNLLIIDTGNNTSYANQNLIDMVQNLGYKTTFKQGYQVD